LRRGFLETTCKRKGKKERKKKSLGERVLRERSTQGRKGGRKSFFQKAPLKWGSANDRRPPDVKKKREGGGALRLLGRQRGRGFLREKECQVRSGKEGRLRK